MSLAHRVGLYPIRTIDNSRRGTVGHVPSTGYASVNDVDMYWESRGSGGTPLIMVHGGYGLVGMFGDLLDRLAEQRQVIAIELQGHGHTGDIDRPFEFEDFGDDIAGLI